MSLVPWFGFYPGPEGRSSALQALLLFPASVAPWPTLSTPGLPLALLVAPAFLGIVEPHRNLIEAKHSDLQQAAASQPRSLHRGQQRSGSVRCACARQGGSCMRVGPYRRAPPRPEMALFSFLCNLPAPGCDPVVGHLCQQRESCHLSLGLARAASLGAGPPNAAPWPFSQGSVKGEEIHCGVVGLELRQINASTNVRDWPCPIRLECVDSICPEIGRSAI